ncbi:hypothetical protein DCAR_0626106 [Daucus carota subsp. sativus]|uniref:Protein kinase domain-containing protein n=1 Tax=Daucus carota subsp. sativus TaxID=79200 RepID=A0AAF0XEL9_DAUCS|nr:hypothetical protein DCAR_0626106 [Daucus carota subsp. sativus]
MCSFKFFVRVLVAVVVVVIGAGSVTNVSGQNEKTDDCNIVKRCKKTGPSVRFPFYLSTNKLDSCVNSYPSGFKLFCRGKDTVLQFKYLSDTSVNGQQLSFSIDASVNEINYNSQEVILGSFMFTSPHALIRASLNSNSSSDIVAPFKISEGNLFLNNYTFFNCSSEGDRLFRSFVPSVTLFSNEASFQYYAFLSNSFYTFDVPIRSCTRKYSVSGAPLLLDYRISERHYDQLRMNWFTPNCRKCEASGEYCKFSNNTSSSSSSNLIRNGTSTVCFPIPAPPPAVRGIVPSALFIALVLAGVLYYVIRSRHLKEEDRQRIEMFMNDYKAMKPTRYSYVDIKKITNHFSEKLGQGGFGSVYKGQITDEIVVAVKVLNIDSKSNGDDFINEVGTIGRIHHVNVVRLVGYCADGCNRALVYEFQPNDSLQKFTYSAINNKNNFLGWEKMQEIALGIAKGIEYLHQGCAQQILHFDIKPHNILLDQTFTPKIADFGLAKLCSKDQSIVSMTMARGTIGYIAPEVFSRNFGKVSSKSDVYSFGMLLLEMVGARNNEAAVNSSDTYFPEWIYRRLEGGGEVAIQILEKEEDTNIARKLTIVGLWCIGWHPADRPSMTRVIQMLEKPDCPAMPPNPFGAASSAPFSAAYSVHSSLFSNELDVISESEKQD